MDVYFYFMFNILIIDCFDRDRHAGLSDILVCNCLQADARTPARILSDKHTSDLSAKVS